MSQLVNQGTQAATMPPTDLEPPVLHGKAVFRARHDLRGAPTLEGSLLGAWGGRGVKVFEGAAAARLRAWAHRVLG